MRDLVVGNILIALSMQERYSVRLHMLESFLMENEGTNPLEGRIRDFASSLNLKYEVSGDEVFFFKPDRARVV